MVFFTSNVGTVADYLFADYHEEKNYKSVLFIDIATEPELTGNEKDDEWFYNDLRLLERQGYQVDRFSITSKTREEIGGKIDEYKVIYMSGGNTVYLLQQLQKTDSVSVVCGNVKAGKTYIGTSAGSIIAGLKMPIYLEDTGGVELNDYTDFGFTNIMAVPHWGAPHFKEIYLERQPLI